MVQKILRKNDISKQTKGKKKHMWLSGRLHIEGRMNEGPRLQRKHEDENEAKQNKCNTRERRNGICKPNAREDTSSRHLWLVNKGERTSTSPLALGYPPLGSSRHVRAYDCMPLSSPGFLCSGLLHHEISRPLFRRSAPFPLVLGCSRPLVGVDTGSSEVIQEAPHPLFFLALHTARAPHHFSEHHALRWSRILHAHHKSRKQDPPPAESRPDALTFRLDKRVQIGNRVVGALVLSPSDVGSQERVVGSAQRVVVTGASRDAAVQHCLEYLDS